MFTNLNMYSNTNKYTLSFEILLHLYTLFTHLYTHYLYPPAVKHWLQALYNFYNYTSIDFSTI